MVAAFLFELVAYLRGCGRSHLRLLSWSLAGLIVMAAVGLLGLRYGLSLAVEGGGFAPYQSANALISIHPNHLRIRLSVRQDRMAGLLIVFPRITEADRNERWQNLKPAFSDTAWSAAMERVDIANALAVFIAADGDGSVVDDEPCRS